MKRYFTHGSTQWMFDGQSTFVKSTQNTEWSPSASTAKSLEDCDVVQETDENWRPLTKPEPIDDGGSAFPHGETIVEQYDSAGKFLGNRVHHESTGMSLRDWFAGQALSGIMSNSGSFASMSDSQVAETSYSAADAMLAARKAKP